MQRAASTLANSHTAIAKALGGWIEGVAGVIHTAINVQLKGASPAG